MFYDHTSSHSFPDADFPRPFESFSRLLACRDNQRESTCLHYDNRVSVADCVWCELVCCGQWYVYISEPPLGILCSCCEHYRHVTVILASCDQLQLWWHVVGKIICSCLLIQQHLILHVLRCTLHYTVLTFSVCLSCCVTSLSVSPLACRKQQSQSVVVLSSSEYPVSGNTRTGHILHVFTDPV